MCALSSHFQPRNSLSLCWLIAVDQIIFIYQNDLLANLFQSCHLPAWKREGEIKRESLYVLDARRQYSLVDELLHCHHLLPFTLHVKRTNKRVTFSRNCGAASEGKWNTKLWIYQLSWWGKLATVKRLKAGVSPVLALRHWVSYNWQGRLSLTVVWKFFVCLCFFFVESWRI